MKTHLRRRNERATYCGRTSDRVLAGSTLTKSLCSCQMCLDWLAQNQAMGRDVYAQCTSCGEKFIGANDVPDEWQCAGCGGLVKEVLK